MADNKAGISRRGFITTGAAGLAAGALTMATAENIPAHEQNDKTPKAETSLRSRIKQSVCKWCYGKIGLEELADFASKTGLKSIELADPQDWPILKKYGLVCAMSNSHGITKGLNRTANHDECLEKIRKSIELTSQAGFPNVICFSGNRDGMDDDQGLKNCLTAIKQVIGLAEQKNVTICMELLNSKLDHKDYMCDRTKWGAELVKSVGSERFKLLYDIYHMQVQEGDVIATIRQYADCIGHYHTAGVPGRNELDENQELNYPAIVRAIIDTGFGGYLGQEFIPRGDPLKSLAEAVRICDV